MDPQQTDFKESDLFYQCKLCNTGEKFRTTAELQRHRRLNHRDPVVAAATTVRAKDKLVAAGSGHHGTQSSKISLCSTEMEISLKGDRTLACASCRINFDTRDAVVPHLPQSRNENVSWKCPFCAKVLLNNSWSEDVSNEKFDDAEIGSKQNKNSSEGKKRRISSGKSKSDSEKAIEGNNLLADEVNTSVKKRTTSSSYQKMIKVPCRRSIGGSLAKHVQRKQKQYLSSESPSSVNTERVNANYSLGHSEHSSESYSAKKLSAAEKLTHKGSVEYLKQDFELTYEKIRRRCGTADHRTSGLGTGTTISSRGKASQNSEDWPLKISVAINSSPYPSKARLAVPKRKHFEKGDIRCPYCGFQAKSVREIQFHVNTHMSKSYPCGFCSHIYRSKQAVIKHTEKHHADELNKLKAPSNVINSSHEEKQSEYDQSPMSNYSTSLSSDNTENENYLVQAGQSLSTSESNSLDGPVAEACNNTGYNVPGNPYSISSSTNLEQIHRVSIGFNYGVLIDQQSADEGASVKVLDIANF